MTQRDPQNIMFWGTYERSQGRVQNAIRQMEAAGLTVRELVRDIWFDMPDKHAITTFQKIRLLWRMVCAYVVLILRFLFAKRPDVIVISHPCMFDLIMIKPFAMLKNVPIVWNMLIPLHEVATKSRGIMLQKSFAAQVLDAVEKLSARCANLVVLDTRAHAEHIKKLYKISHVTHVPIGFSIDLSNVPPSENREVLSVIMVARFAPFHGLKVAYEAAKLARDMPVQWLFVGVGQEGRIIEESDKIQHIEWLSLDDMRAELEAHHVVLGVFSDEERVDYVVPYKIYDAIAVGRPFITKRSTAVAELMGGSPGYIMLNKATPELLLSAILSFREDYPPSPLFTGIREKLSDATLGEEWKKCFTTLFSLSSLSA
jgi:glycosyltransferase involved in cell wall biosynthesis